MWYFLTFCVLVLGPKGAQPKDARHCVPCEPVVFSVLRLQFCSLTGQRFLPGSPEKRCHRELQAVCNLYFLL